MGCHTWFAKKVERDYETAKRNVIDRLESNIEFNEKMLRDPLEETRVAYEWTDDNIKRFKRNAERQLRMVKGGYCKNAVMNRQPEHSFYNEHGFFVLDDDLPHDIFRIGYNSSFEKPYNSYCNVYLYSLIEMINFIAEQMQRQRDGEQYWHIDPLTPDQLTRLNDFWTAYPNGCIHFG